MDKDIIKEIFLLIFEIIKVLCEIIWGKIKGFIDLIWDRFFGMADVSSRERGDVQDWGVAGEDTWPIAPEINPVRHEEPKPGIESKEKEYVSAPTVPELPGNYGDNRIVLMVRDAEWLFSYWEIQKDVVDNVIHTHENFSREAKLVLRVYDVTDIIFDGSNAHKYFTVEVTGGVRNWYIHAGEPNRSFCVDIGLLSSQGIFRTLFRSNTVRTPRVSVSEVVDERWMSITALYEKIGVPMGLGISESVFERAHKGWQEIVKEGVPSSEYLSGLSDSKK